MESRLLGKNTGILSELGPSGIQSGQGDVKDSKKGSFKYVTTKEKLKSMWACY